MATRRSRLIGGLAALAMPLLTAACVEVTAGDIVHVEREERRFSVSGKPEITLRTFDGSIEIRPWDRNEVLVVVEKRAATPQAAETIDVEMTQDGNRVGVTARAAPRVGIGWFGPRRARLIVSVPASADLQARSGDGSLDVEGVSGRLELRSGDGSIRGRRLAGQVIAQTGDGSIRLDEVSGALEANTGDGSIVAGGTFSTLRVRTGDGSVVLQAAAGSITADAWNIATGDGSVTLELPADFSAELDAHTGDGTIAMREVTVSHVTGRMARNTVRGQLGSGGRSLRIRTGDGSITLRRR